MVNQLFLGYFLYRIVLKMRNFIEIIHKLIEILNLISKKNSDNFNKIWDNNDKISDIKWLKKSGRKQLFKAQQESIENDPELMKQLLSKVGPKYSQNQNLSFNEYKKVIEIFP